MLVSEAIAYCRVLLATPGATSTRWTDAQLTLLIDRAVKSLVEQTLFPESRLVAMTLLNIQEYPLPDMHTIERVYLNGQRIVETPGNIDTLEGSQILYADQSGQGTPVAGSGGPPGAGGQMQPQWDIQTPVSYPFLNAWGGPAPWSQPFAVGQRPRFYRRGGFIGIVPGPGAAGQSLVVEGVRVPTTLKSTTDMVIVPDNFLEAIANFVCYRAWRSDKDELAQAMATAALGDYNAEVRKLRTWKRQYSADEGATIPVTLRSRYAYGGSRTGDG